MTYLELEKHCLAYLEQDVETQVMQDGITQDDLENNDTFQEYAYNIEHAIYMGLTRFVTSQILPLQEYEFEGNTAELIETINGKKYPLAHKIKTVIATNEDGELIDSNIAFAIVGNKVYLREPRKKDLKYIVLYNPTIWNLSVYANKFNCEKYEIELNDLNVPDEMAIQIKYLVYGDMKSEENASLALSNSNKFESYLSETARNLIENNDTEYTTINWGDIYGN